MRVLLIKPGDNPSIVGYDPIIRAEPLGLEILAACIPQHEVKILDLRIEDNLRQTLYNFKPDVVGVTSLTVQVEEVKKMMGVIKAFDKNILTVIGGHHATFKPEDFDSINIDVVVIGEGEITFSELIEHYSRGKSFDNIAGIAYRHSGRLEYTARREYIKDLDKVPAPRRDLVKKYQKKYFYLYHNNFATVETSRGCVHNCSFCAVSEFYNRTYRVKSPHKIVEDIEKTGADGIFFIDDNFLQDFARSEALIKLIEKKGIRKKIFFITRSDHVVQNKHLIKRWKKVGLWGVFIGIDGVNPDSLSSFNKSVSMEQNVTAVKILQENNINILAAIIIRPEYAEADFEEVKYFIEDNKLSSVQLTILTPLPGSSLYKRKFNEILSHNYELYDCMHLLFEPRVGFKNFYKEFSRLYKSSLLRTYGIKDTFLKIKMLLNCPGVFRFVRKIISFRSYYSLQHKNHAGMQNFEQPEAIS